MAVLCRFGLIRTWVVAGCLLLTACSGGSADEASIFDELGLSGDGRSEDVSVDLANERERAEDMAVCMREQGYAFVASSTLADALERSVGIPDPGSLEYAQQIGYGHFRAFPSAILSHPSAKQNANDVLADGLSASELRIYKQIMLGDTFSYERSAGVDEELFLDGGCYGRAHAESEIARNTELNNLLAGPSEELRQRVNADAQVVAYDRAWSECMASAGFEFESVTAAQKAVSERFSRLWQSVTFPVVDGYSAEQLRALSSTERGELYENEPVYDQDEWERGLQWEISMAVADNACQGEDRRGDLYHEVRQGFEEEFIAENASLIDQLTELRGE